MGAHLAVAHQDLADEEPDESEGEAEGGVDGVDVHSGPILERKREGSWPVPWPDYAAFSDSWDATVASLHAYPGAH